MMTRIVFYTFKLPVILILITLGLMLEFIVELPFRVLCTLDARFGERRGGA